MKKTLKELAELLGATCVTESQVDITGIAPLDTATRGDISFLSTPKYLDQLETTAASAVIVKRGFEDRCNTAVLIHEDPYRCFAILTNIFNNEDTYLPSVHRSSQIADSATVAATAHIGPNVSIGEGVSIGERSVIEAGTVIAQNCVIGDDCRIYPNVTLYREVKLGDEVQVHSGTIIGCDGFGFAPDPKGKRKWHKIHQLGTVIIGDRVDIGSSTTIDRGALGDTIIENDCIIDSQVHIGHNCVIGEGSALAGCVGLAGSSIIGKGCLLAGGVGIAGHLSIADGVQVTGMTMVTKSITKSGSYSSGTPMMTTASWRKAAVRFSQLESLNKRLKALEKAVESD